MNMSFEGLSEFQKDLIEVAQKKLPKETNKVMRKIGNKATNRVRKKSRTLVKKDTGNYQKSWKRGKVFKGQDDEIVVRVINSSPHAHLIEDGHRQVTKDGREVGFVTGKKVLKKGMDDFDNSGEFEKMLGDWLDEELNKGNL